MQELTLLSRVTLAGLWCLPSLPFGCVLCEGGWGILWCRLKLATIYIGFGDSWEGLCGRPWSVAACALPRATWYDLQSDVQMVATCAGLGGT